MTLQLNKQQSELITNLVQFYNAPNRKTFILSGQAGVGKTTCVRYFIQDLLDTIPGIKICLAAPTNKAVRVLSETTDIPSVTYKTIYSVLGLRMMANGEFKELTDGGQCRISDFDLVVIDEGSMCNTSLLDYIKKKTDLADTKIVVIGDKEQLPPVGEEVSPIWTRYDVNFELTEVMRHQNSILDFVQSIRGNVSPEFVSPGKQVHMCSDEKFMLAIRKYAERGDFHAGDAKAIAWRNVTVDWLNEYIRSNNEKTKSDLKFVKGDRVVIKEPIIVGETTIASTDDEGDIVSAEVTQHVRYSHLKAWKLRIFLDTGESITAYTIHESSAKALDNMLEDMKNKKMWREFWKIKEAFHNVSYGYALTAHRSQGSTFKTVFVDAGDVMLNRKSSERTKCLYVACSRASEMLYIFP